MKGQNKKTNDKVIVRIDYLPSVNYSMVNSGMVICNKLVLENNDDKDWHHLSVEIKGSLCRFQPSRSNLISPSSARLLKPSRPHS